MSIKTELLYTKQAAHYLSEPDINNVLKDILAIRTGIVVNLINGSSGQSVLFSREALAEILQPSGGIIEFEVLPQSQYSQLLRQQLANVTETCKELCHALCTFYVQELYEQAESCLFKLQNISLFLESLLLQEENDKIRSAASDLAHVRQEMSLACFYYDDNVRLLDDIQLVLDCLNRLLEHI